MKNILSTIALICFGLASFSGSMALAQTPDCAPYEEPSSGDATSRSTVVAAIPDQYLVNTAVAIPCLVKAIANLRTEIVSPSLSETSKARLLRATGGLRTIFSNAQADELRKAVALFRDNDNRDVVNVLSFGVRSSDYNTRLNALLILGNIIDNTTVCVPVDHLYDPAILGDDVGSTKGRANLLGIISVVAPWAYKENFLAISNVREYWVSKQPRYRDLDNVLENIRVRLAANTENKKDPLRGALSGCINYKPIWAKAPDWTKE